MTPPRPGDEIYVPTRSGTSDDFRGGVCTVDAVYTRGAQSVATPGGTEAVPAVLGALVRGGSNSTWVSVSEDPGSWFEWETYLSLHQEEWRREYGDRPGRGVVGPPPLEEDRGQSTKARFNMRDAFRLILFIAVLLLGFLAVAVARAGEPCCQIRSINTNGVVTAKDKHTGRTFQFNVKDQSVLRGLHVGQDVWADFTSQAVSLAANGEPCCNIVGAGVKGPAATAALNNGAPCCEIVADPAVGSHMGQLVVAFPQGADTGATPVGYSQAHGTAATQSGLGNQAWQVAPGTYTVEINKVLVPNVRVQAGHDTKVKVGVLRVKATGSTWANVLDAKGKTLVGGYGSRDIGLPAGSYKVQIGNLSQAVKVQEGKVTQF